MLFLNTSLIAQCIADDRAFQASSSGLTYAFDDFSNELFSVVIWDEFSLRTTTEFEHWRAVVSGGQFISFKNLILKDVVVRVPQIMISNIDPTFIADEFEGFERCIYPVRSQGQRRLRNTAAIAA